MTIDRIFDGRQAIGALGGQSPPDVDPGMDGVIVPRDDIVDTQRPHEFEVGIGHGRGETLDRDFDILLDPRLADGVGRNAYVFDVPYCLHRSRTCYY